MESVWLPVSDGPVEHVSAAVHHPATTPCARVLLTHGAGGDLDGAGLVALAQVLVSAGATVLRANLPYRQADRRVPPRAESSVPYLVQLAEAAHAYGQEPLIVGGKSYGGRVASMAVAGGLEAAGLIFYGYPLHPPGRPERLRVDHWPRIAVPCLFLQGTRDAFCELDLLRAKLGELGGPADLEVVEGGDHSLRLARAASPDGRVHPEEEVVARLAGTVSDWLERVAGR